MKHFVVPPKLIFSKLAIFFLLVCIGFASLSVFSIDSPRSGDLVFCPLQKSWVKTAPPSRPRAAGLDYVCAGTANKTAFLNRLALNSISARGSQSTPEALFFDYEVKGDRAFSDLPPAPGPELLLVTLSKAPSGINGSRYETVTHGPERFRAGQLPSSSEPETVSNFPLTRLGDLETYLFSPHTRGPPVSL